MHYSMIHLMTASDAPDVVEVKSIYGGHEATYQTNAAGSGGIIDERSRRPVVVRGVHVCERMPRWECRIEVFNIQ